MISNGCQCTAHQVTILIPLLLSAIFIPLTQSALYPFGIGHGDKKIEFDLWKSGSEQIYLDTSMPLLGDGILSNVWVNSAGSLTYWPLLTSSKIIALIDNIAIAPYFVESLEGPFGAVYYRQTTTNNALLNQVKADVSSALLLPPTVEDIVTIDYEPIYAMIVTWSNVASPQVSTELNTFQVVLTTDGMRSYAIFNYGDNMQWSTSSSGEYAAAGIFASPNAESTCSYELPYSQTYEAFLLSQTFGNSGETGSFVLIISEPLLCYSKFQSACEATLPSHDWGSSLPYFAITGNSWDVYAHHFCNVGFNIKPGINNERIDCVYEPDYYISAWEKEPAKCIDLEATKTFIVTTEIGEVGNDTEINPDNLTDKEKEELERVIETAITTILNLTDIIVTVTNITTDDPTTPGTRTDQTKTVTVTTEVKIPPYTHKKITSDKITEIITEVIKENEQIGGVTFVPVVNVTDETDPCLQGCMCRFKMDPKLCPRSKNPLIKPDSCCGGCNGKPYSSTIKACCNNQHIYDPLKARCCDGSVRKGATGKCP